MEKGGGGGSKGGGSKGGGPEGWEAQNFALFFLLWGSSRGILVVFEVPGRSNVHVWSSRAVVCEPRRQGLVGPPGFHTTRDERA